MPKKIICSKCGKVMQPGEYFVPGPDKCGACVTLPIQVYMVAVVGSDGVLRWCDHGRSTLNPGCLVQSW